MTQHNTSRRLVAVLAAATLALTGLVACTGQDGKTVVTATVTVDATPTAATSDATSAAAKKIVEKKPARSTAAAQEEPTSSDAPQPVDTGMPKEKNPNCKDGDVFSAPGLASILNKPFPAQTDPSRVVHYKLGTEHRLATNFSCTGLSYAVVEWFRTDKTGEFRGTDSSIGQTVFFWYNGYPLVNKLDSTWVADVKTLTPDTVTVAYMDPFSFHEPTGIEQVDITYFLKDGQVHAAGETDRVFTNNDTFRLTGMTDDSHAGSIVVEPSNFQYTGFVDQIPLLKQTETSLKLRANSLMIMDSAHAVDRSVPAIECYAFGKNDGFTSHPISDGVHGPASIRCLAKGYNMQPKTEPGANPSGPGNFIFLSTGVVTNVGQTDSYKNYSATAVDGNNPGEVAVRWYDDTGRYLGLIGYNHDNQEVTWVSAAGTATTFAPTGYTLPFDRFAQKPIW